MAGAQTACVTKSRGLRTVSSRPDRNSPFNEHKLPSEPVKWSRHPDCALSFPSTRFAYSKKGLDIYSKSRAAIRKSWSSCEHMQHQARVVAGLSKGLQQKAFLNGRSFNYKNFALESFASSSSIMPHLRRKSNTMVRCQASPKIANLTASRSMTAPLPLHSDSEGRPRTLSEFLKLPVGRESMLKGQSCKKRELIDDNTFRCYLRSIEAFKFSVSPVIDVRVTSTNDTCTVEMLQCRFLGSEAVERQNNRFSASFRNFIDWRENGAAQRELQNEIKLDLALEVFTPPFTMLPLGAVERPGSAFLQALLDRVAPAFVDSLLADFEAWAKGELEESELSFTEDRRAEEVSDLNELDGRS